MAIAPHYYRIPVYAGGQQAFAYFYRAANGLYDLKHGWWLYTTRQHRTLASAVAEFRSRFEQRLHNEGNQWTVAVGNAVEVSWEEVRQANPARE